MKEIRTREENLDDLRRRRKNVMIKADAAEKKLNKMGSEVRGDSTKRSIEVSLCLTSAVEQISCPTD